MAAQITVDRRTLLSLLVCAGTQTLSLSQARAARRARYGGSSELHLPLNLNRIDPHDPHDLATTLLGEALFETLYARGPNGSIYPTLASGLPTLSGNRTVVELRPQLKFSSGRSIDATEVTSALRRAAAYSPALTSLGGVDTVRGAPLRLSFPQKDSKILGELLSNPRAAIVPSDFSPGAPDTSGAFQATQTGVTLKLVRNPLAPRGGAFLDEVIVKSATLSDCLRAFEAGRSDLGFLGAGLHRERQGISRFRLDPVGLALVVPGTRLRTQLAVGSLHEALARLPEGPFNALGVERPRHSARRWNGADSELLVPQDEPWLSALAEEVESAWSAKGHAISVRRVPTTKLAQLRKSGQFDLMLQFLSTCGMAEADTTSHLFQLDGRAAPRGGRTLSPLEGCRQLSLGILGALTPSGAVSSRMGSLLTRARLSLEDAQILE